MGNCKELMLMQVSYHRRTLDPWQGNWTDDRVPGPLGYVRTLPLGMRMSHHRLFLPVDDAFSTTIPPDSEKDGVGWKIQFNSVQQIFMEHPSETGTMLGTGIQR